MEDLNIICNCTITSNENRDSGSWESGLNPKYRFDNFVVGKSNMLAHATALAVAENPGMKYNPLFVYGEPGLGKTHLVQAIGNQILKKNPASRIRYVSSEMFTNGLIEAIRKGRNSPRAINEFRDKYRNVDIFLIDDIQFIIGKESTQIEFFNTFVSLYQKNKQIVIASDKPAKEMPQLEEYIKAKFDCGISVDVQMPDYDTRVAILKGKRKDYGYHISDEIIDYAACFYSSVSKLEGVLHKLNALYELNSRVELTLNQAKEILADELMV